MKFISYIQNVKAGKRVKIVCAHFHSLLYRTVGLRRHGVALNEKYSVAPIKQKIYTVEMLIFDKV